MADQEIYYIRLVGVNTKESLLIESFLNMASNEQLAVKVDKIDEYEPKAIVVDELFHSDSLEVDFPDAKVVIIGDDVHYDADDYMHRPLRWSTFEDAVINHVSLVVQPTVDEVCSVDDNKSLSGSTQIVEAQIDEGMSDISGSAQITEVEIDKSISGLSGSTQIIEAQTDEGMSGISDFDIYAVSAEIDKAPLKAPSKTIDQAQYSVSEFSISQIAVKEVKQGDQVNDYSESVSHSYSEIGTVIEEDVELIEMEHSRVKAERTLFEGGGLVLGPNIVFWENFDCLMTVKSRPVLYILSSMGSVYSEYNYLDWGLLLKSKYARVYPLPKDWSAQEKLSKYPLSWLVWFSSIARSKGYLLKSVEKDGYFMLDSWPAFDQIYNDNNHLRLSSLLSTSPYSIQGLVSKTRLPTKIIVSFLNACEKQGLLKMFATMEEAVEAQKHNMPPKAG